jgi:hypothetical protein
MNTMRENISLLGKRRILRGYLFWQACILIVLVPVSSCHKFLEVDLPENKILNNLVFADDAMATSAVIGMYIDLYSNGGFAAGTNQSVVSLAGLSADELRSNKNDAIFLAFQNNAIEPSGVIIASLWSSMYKSIYDANSILEGLNASKSLSAATKNQLQGEALFVRAFCYFYLVNFFGSVPLAVSTDFRTNNALSRSAASDIYNQVKTDLVAAEDLLADDYPGTDRSRVNKSSATALLARVYLYTGDWGRAEDKSTNVIAKTDMYSLPDSLSAVFLLNSKEAIWQLKPNDGVGYTEEGYWFSPINGPFNNVIRESVMTTFEPGDRRQLNWTTSVIGANDTAYLPYKYKRYTTTASHDEYSMVLRLAEVYFIRCEARLQQDKLSLAIDDLDKIRMRAGLPLIQSTNPDISKEDLLLAIQQEKRIEFLAEWGHRWLDLKRWGRAENVLSPIKPGWSNNDLLYPIPSGELNRNSNLKPQNNGY